MDSQLDRLQTELPSPETCSAATHDFQQVNIPQETPRVQLLKRSIKQMTTLLAGSAPNTLISRSRIVDILHSIDTNKNFHVTRDLTDTQSKYEQELEWLLAAKTTLLVYGMIFQSLFEQTLPLSEDLFYWDSVLTSYRYTALYCLQTAPLKLLGVSKDIYRDASRKFTGLKDLDLPSLSTAVNPQESLPESFRRFYSLVSISTKERMQSLRSRTTMTSPFTIVRHDIRKHQTYIRRLRETQASALGILVGETLNFDTREDRSEDWKSLVTRASYVLESLTTTAPDVTRKFDDLAFQDLILQPHNSKAAAYQDVSARSVVCRLQKILQAHIPAHVKNSQVIASRHGRPTVIIRYWMPAMLLLFSSSRILGIISRRQADLQTWIHESAITVTDFWTNWVLDPVKKIIGTIRHDADSEVALMSRRSLAADMESLERMVVDFAIDNPDVSGASVAGSLQGQELDLLRQHVKEGDLTPVLKAYERDLRHPFRGAIQGELVRALLIQIQKTKVDVEVAISGIDRLLKSQELVFGLVGLTPGLLATWGFLRWSASVIGIRKGVRRGKVNEETIRVLR